VPCSSALQTPLTPAKLGVTDFKLCAGRPAPTQEIAALLSRLKGGLAAAAMMYGDVWRKGLLMLQAQ
jgi:hypothetical protein